MSLLAYWSANLVFDILKVYMPCILTVAVIFIFDMGYESSWATILVYPIGVVPFAYAFSFIFKEESLAQTVMLFSNVVAGSIGGMAVFIIRFVPTTMKEGDFLGKILKIFPNYTISNSIIYDSSKDIFNSTRTFAQIADPTINDATLEPWEANNVGGDLIALGIHFAFGLLVIFIVEMGPWNNMRSGGSVKSKNVDEDVDDDVKAEEERVNKLKPADALIRINNLRKVYRTGFRKATVAIENTSLAVDKGECFALLGVNGAGKTTTFKSLTKDVIPTSGEVSVMGQSVIDNFNKARQYIGYCPQFDTIFDALTVKEHLEFQAIVKGIPVNMREEMCKRSIESLNLGEYTDKLA